MKSNLPTSLNRLPPHLRELLREFCFSTPADLVNFLAFLLTGVLVNHFVSRGKPLALIDGNQPGVGKTLLGQITSWLFSGAAANLIHYTRDDEELAKRLGAEIQDRSQSVILIDNAKTVAGQAISSPVLEANVLAPKINIRRLGKSELIERENSLLWALTSNQTQVSQDLITRALPIRLEYEGNPGRRRFARDPVEYARRYRIQILAELYGLVDYWNQAGRLPEAPLRILEPVHRRDSDDLWLPGTAD